MNLVVRADASPRIGTGHVMRCLALAQEWQKKGGKVAFASAEYISSLEEHITSAGIEVMRVSAAAGSHADAAQTVALAKQQGASWVVVDGYQFDTGFQKWIKESGKSLFMFDDYGHADHNWADIVLNQNIAAPERWYACREYYTQLLLGSQYTLLRQEFLKYRCEEKKVPDSAHNVLVTLGGSDPDNHTVKVIKALQEIPNHDFEVQVVIGAGNPYFEDLQSVVNEKQSSVRLIRQPQSMPELMQWADIALAAAGTTAWELAFMGVPSLLIIVAENQRLNAEHLNDEGVALNLGDAEKLGYGEIIHAVTKLSQDPQQRSHMAQQGRKLIDGYGVQRVVAIMRNNFFTLREATERDCQQLWQWANEEEVRSVSFSPAEIPWEQHTAWFSQQLHDVNSRIYIAISKQGNAVGQARYQIDGEESIISVNLDKQCRGQGMGSVLIENACIKLFSSTSVKTIHAYIKPENIASIKSFTHAGFKEFGMGMINGNQALRFLLVKDIMEINNVF